MEQKYKLKTEALKYFSNKLSTQIDILSYWESMNIDRNALVEAKDTYIEYGHQSLTNKFSRSMAGWESNEGNPSAHFYFTAFINDMPHDLYTQIEEKDIRLLMDDLDFSLNNWSIHIKNKYLTDEA